METILIADDHEIVRRGVRLIVESLRVKYNCIEAATCADVVKALSGNNVNYAVLDMFLPDGNVLTTLEHDPGCYSRINILVYSMNAEKIYARRLMEKGARGFVNKQASIKELEKAIQNLLKGEIYLSARLKEALLTETKPGSQNPIDLLSDRELEVVEYITTGMGTKEIAARMNLDITTISTYRRRAFEKLDVQNPIELKEKFLLYKIDE